MPVDFHSSAPLPQLAKWYLIVGLVLVLGGFGAATRVAPDPRGFGTHQQFGFPPCTFRIMFGITCPACGGTTCVAHFVRGHWIQSAKTHLSVFLLAVSALLYIPWSVVSLHTKTYWGLRDPVTFAVILLFSLSVISLIQWGTHFI